MKSEFEKKSQFSFLMNSFFGWLFTLLCATGLYFFSQYLLAVFILPIIGLALRGFDLNSFVTCVIAGLLGCFFFFVGVPIGRFFLRVLPPRLSGERRIGALVTVTIVAIAGVANAFYRSSLVTGIALIDNASVLQTFVFFSYASISFCFLLVFAAPHLSPRSFLEKPFILFLRRFSTFSDRSIQNALLKVSPVGKSVAFLTSTQSKAGDWDPFRIGFAGLKIWHPINSTPRFLRSSNEDWKRAAEELINRAEVITLDLSQGSGAIRTEIGMIENSNRWASTIILINKLDLGFLETQQLIDYKNKGATIVKYKKSWEGSLLRLLLGIPIVVGIGLWLNALALQVFSSLSILLKGGVDAVIAYYWSLGLMFFGSIDQTHVASDPAFPVIINYIDYEVIIPAASVSSLAISFLVYLVFFGRPTIDQQASKSLKLKCSSDTDPSPKIFENSVQLWPAHFSVLFNRVFGKTHLSWHCFFGSCVTSLLGFVLCTLIYMQAASGEWAAFLESKDPFLLGVDLKPIVWLGILAILILPSNYISLMKTRFAVQYIRRSRSIISQLTWIVADFISTGAILVLFMGGYLFFFAGLQGYWIEGAKLFLELIPAWVNIDLPNSLANLNMNHRFLAIPVLNISLLNPVADPEQRLITIPVWSTFFTTVCVWLYLIIQTVKHLNKPLCRKHGFLQYALPVESRSLCAFGAVMAFVAISCYCLAVLLTSIGYRYDLSSLQEPEMVIVQPGILRGGGIKTDGYIKNKESKREYFYTFKWEKHIKKGFAIGKYEVTFEEYDYFARATRRALPDDEGWGRGQQPVINISWYDAVEYANWLSEQTGRRYRLPTELEWEYAARGETDTIYWWGDEIKKNGKVWANCNGCGGQWQGKQTAPVGSFYPNPWGLYNTAGNVNEWVQDDYGYYGNVIRGGTWKWDPKHMRFNSLVAHEVSDRKKFRPYSRDDDLGFRLARDLD
jgi:formylglycine-generating enzyme required for sulfatase activity